MRGADLREVIHRSPPFCGWVSQACAMMRARMSRASARVSASSWPARRLLRGGGRLEKGQGQLHGNSPHWPLALGCGLRTRLRRASRMVRAWSKSASLARQRSTVLRRGGGSRDAALPPNRSTPPG